MIQQQKSFTRRWLSCSGWCRERVSLVFSYQGSQFIWKEQWRTLVNILRLAVGCLDSTINRKTRNTEPEFGTDRSRQTRQNPWVDGSSQTRHNLQVDGYGSRFGLPRRSRSGFWMVLNRTEPFLRSEPIPLAGYRDPLLTLFLMLCSKLFCRLFCMLGGLSRSPSGPIR